MPSPVGSVVIPAHNEEGVIGRCLSVLLADARPGELDVVVVCNGCTDDTAAVARKFTGVRVEVLDIASKHAALNHGDSVATTFPRIYLDADVELTTVAARQTIAVLAGGTVMVAAPRPTFALDDRPWMVRAFYRTWLRSRFITEEMVGNGVYALSAEGRSRFGDFPPVTGDDYFVLSKFGLHERLSLRTSSFRIHPPRDVRSLVRVRTRVYFGNTELDDRPGMDEDPPSDSTRSAIELTLGCRSPIQFAETLVYLTTNGVAKVLSWRKRQRSAIHSEWERDESSRKPARSTL